MTVLVADLDATGRKRILGAREGAGESERNEGKEGEDGELHLGMNLSFRNIRNCSALGWVGAGAGWLLLQRVDFCRRGKWLLCCV